MKLLANIWEWYLSLSTVLSRPIGHAVIAGTVLFCGPRIAEDLFFSATCLIGDWKCGYAYQSVQSLKEGDKAFDLYAQLTDPTMETEINQKPRRIPAPKKQGN